MEFNFTCSANISCNVSVDVDEEAYKEQFIEECMNDNDEFDMYFFEDWLRDKVESDISYGIIKLEEYMDGTFGFVASNEPDYENVEIESTDCGEMCVDWAV